MPDGLLGAEDRSNFLTTALLYLDPYHLTLFNSDVTLVKYQIAFFHDRKAVEMATFALLNAFFLALFFFNYCTSVKKLFFLFISFNPYRAQLPPTALLERFTFQCEMEDNRLHVSCASKRTFSWENSRDASKKVCRHVPQHWWIAYCDYNTNDALKMSVRLYVAIFTLSGGTIRRRNPMPPEGEQSFPAGVDPTTKSTLIWAKTSPMRPCIHWSGRHFRYLQPQHMLWKNNPKILGRLLLEPSFNNSQLKTVKQKSWTIA